MLLCINKLLIIISQLGKFEISEIIFKENVVQN